ncbi:hypothetical protein EGY25_01965 [Brevundimonas intermedia]|uniref:Uncharacterized protein n=1 Tax=Brevundimonas intermedia TaxID=74315 RepID=A0A4Y9S241_9CAUL|nr:hypothetical protein [Brevundimonas intermedia]TFW13999.1 hypothetical protein EGY25_01965 [Brevundimonas intermedia]
MIPLKRLFMVAGFDDADVTRQVTTLQGRYVSGDVRFVTRQYPANPAKRATYLSDLVAKTNDEIFGVGTAVNFCRRLDQPCARDPSTPKGVGKTCGARQTSSIACGRARPRLVVAVCASQMFDEVFEKLGRGVLMLRMPGNRLPSLDELKQILDDFEPTAALVELSIRNRPRSMFAPVAPDHNFQRLGGHPIARDIQADPAAIEGVLRRYHDNLYDAGFRNPEKRFLHGAYMLDARVAFQGDRLHTTVQIIGPESRKDGFHLLNAYHTYGVANDPGFHFDVMAKDGGAIGLALSDALARKSSDLAEKHLNATPCDRLV